MEPQEIYVLCPQRSQALANSFLEQFLPHRRVAAEDYPFPEFCDHPQTTFATAEEVIDLLESEVQESYSLYWYNLGENEPETAMLFFTKDAGMIVGIVIHSEESGWLTRLATHVGGRFGYVTFEEPPPNKIDIFVEYCKITTSTKLLDGQLIPGTG